MESAPEIQNTQPARLSKRTAEDSIACVVRILGELINAKLFPYDPNDPMVGREIDCE